MTSAVLFSSLVSPAELDPRAVDALLVEIDARQRAPSDYRALALIEQRRGGKSDAVFQSAIYRRDEDERFLILFLRPKAEAGKGYLRVERNMKRSSSSLR
ncbi:MAG: hypothetical protein AAFZ18_13725 [Myxococcota bacterium]